MGARRDRALARAAGVRGDAPRRGDRAGAAARGAPREARDRRAGRVDHRPALPPDGRRQLRAPLAVRVLVRGRARAGLAAAAVVADVRRDARVPARRLSHSSVRALAAFSTRLSATCATRGTAGSLPRSLPAQRIAHAKKTTKTWRTS